MQQRSILMTYGKQQLLAYLNHQQ